MSLQRDLSGGCLTVRRRDGFQEEAQSFPILSGAPAVVTHAADVTLTLAKVLRARCLHRKAPLLAMC